MIVPRMLLLILSSLVLGAHFLRRGQVFLTLICVAIPFLLLIRKRWVLVVVQVLMYAGSLLWLATLVPLAIQRMGSGEAWLRMTLILAVVALMTLGSGLLMNSKTLRDKYSL